MLLTEKDSKYKPFVEKLLARCQEIQTENERFVLRINNVKKMIRRRTRDVEILKARLDRHNDGWRSLPMVAPHPKRKIEQKRGPKPKNKDINTNTAEATTKEKKPRKQRVKKSASDDKLITSTGQGINMTAMDMQDMLYQESQAQQLLMMQQRQMNLKNDQLL
ncbi:uncharacterized protein LOC101887857 [Musca domestica]|uniref:Uncharacterized protein LOC101887857 n=1 Tax=Musca domestica TaxID=7370 RepID=A0A1I8N6S6_MUSDO|nr:uncharacterized protein LOC101887857 [Musca domestica]